MWYWAYLAFRENRRYEPGRRGNHDHESVARLDEGGGRRRV
ncbi:hypothetical protein Aros01_00150 [Streptosporangium roseum]